MLSTSVMTTEMRAAVFYVSSWRTTYVVLVNAGTTTQQLSTLRFSIVNQAGMVMTTIAYISIDFRAKGKVQRMVQCLYQCRVLQAINQAGIVMMMIACIGVDFRANSDVQRIV